MYINESFMHKAILLAKQGFMFVSPNPMVGCAIVRDNRIISTGYHKYYGAKHAEVEAIENARENLQGSDFYINLEPCSHYGKQPPCVLSVIESKPKNVFIAMLDPNPLVCGKGIKMLEEAGINVVVGICKDQAEELNQSFIRYIKYGMPWIISKWAMSLDGNIKTNASDSKKITNNEVAVEVHKIRSSVDAILIGANTLRDDNPLLNVRHVNGRNPLRIIMTKSANICLNYKVFSEENINNTLVVMPESTDCRHLSNIKILQYKDIQDMLSKLAKFYNISRILIEGGASIHHYFINNNLVDEFYTFIAPSIISNLDKKLHINVKNIKNFGDNIMFNGARL